MNAKTATEELAQNLTAHLKTAYPTLVVDALHGDKDQNERTLIMRRWARVSRVVPM